MTLYITFKNNQLVAFNFKNAGTYLHIAEMSFLVFHKLKILTCVCTNIRAAFFSLPLLVLLF